MYKRLNIYQAEAQLSGGKDREPLKGSYKVKTNVFRPFGYYVLGGTDLSGDATRLSAPAHFDDDSSIAGGCEADALCNPRKSVFDIAEKTGQTEIELAVQKLNESDQK